MEKIVIRDTNNNIDLYLDKNTIIELKYNTNLNNYIYYLSFFKLSNNKTYLGNENNYDIYLDNSSGLKHYLKNGIDDLEQLFFNNGYDTILYNGNNNLNDRNRPLLLRISNFTLVCTLAGLLLLNSALDKYINKKIDNYISYQIEEVSNFSINDIRDMIFTSTNLTDKEKEYLYNEDFLNDVLPYINNSGYLKYQYLTKFNNISINTYGVDDNLYDSSSGYYNSENPNVLMIKNYSDISPTNKDTIAHEFVHLCQECYGYNVITEACAELISYEYYNNSKISCYFEQVKNVKILMEIIGTEPIWNYNFTGDFSQIEEKVKPYLSEKQYTEFLNCLSFDTKNIDENKVKFKKLEELLGILYQNINNQDIQNDLIINLIKNDNHSLVRYYFNKRLINQENSYYYDNNNGSYMDISYQEAIDNGLIIIYGINEELVNKEDIIDYINETYDIYYEKDYSIKREIDYYSAKFNINRKTITNNKTYISGWINDIKYEDKDVDELVDDGIIKVTYYLVNCQRISYEDYKNNHYDSTQIIHSSDTILNDNSVYGFVVPKTYLPTINERNNYSLNLSIS